MPHDDVLRGLRIDLATALRERDEARAELARHERCIADNAKAFDVSLGQCLDRAEKAEKALEAMKDRDYEPIKQWIQNDAPEAVRRAYAIMAKAESERDALRGVIGNLLNVMEMQEKRESGAFHIAGEVMWGIWSDAKSQARAALASGGDRG